jgi:hypothetical protein
VTRRVFLSYALADRAFVDRLIAQLRDLSVVGWRSPADLAESDATSLAIRDGMRGSTAVIVLISPASLNSQWVHFEVGAAWAMGKQLIPIVIAGEGIETRLPEPLQDVQWLDARNKPPAAVASEIRAVLA